MKKVLIAPRKYIQGRGVLGELGDYLKLLGVKPLVLWDAPVKSIVGEWCWPAFGRPAWSPSTWLFRVRLPAASGNG
jgi:glycerol dehydrogenase-like iron-containing ADH family enzyme